MILLIISITHLSALSSSWEDVKSYWIFDRGCKSCLAGLTKILAHTIGPTMTIPPRDNTSHYIPYQAPSTHTRRRSIFARIPGLSSINVTRVYQKVSGTYSRRDILPTTSSRQVEHRNCATTNAKASDTASVSVSTASGDSLSMAIFGYFRAVEDYA